MRPDLTELLKDAWTVLRSRGYRKKLWPIDVPITKAVNEYFDAIDKLLKDQKVGKLVAGDDVKPDSKVVDDLNRQFQAASDRLKTTLKETANLMSELNDIKVRKMGASAINCYSGGQKLVPDRSGRQPARHGARDRADAD